MFKYGETAAPFNREYGATHFTVSTAHLTTVRRKSPNHTSLSHTGYISSRIPGFPAPRDLSPDRSSEPRIPRRAPTASLGSDTHLTSAKQLACAVSQHTSFRLAMLSFAPIFALLGLAAASPFEKQAALAACLSSASVPTSAPGTLDWKLDASPYNLRLNFTPVAISVPTAAEHVQNTIACAVKLGVRANAKCGGHSYGSFGLGGEDGHLTIELDRMNDVVLDTATGIAKVQGGARLGHVASELWTQGKRAISHGTCPG